MRTSMRLVPLALALALFAIQLVPYGRNHSNPPVSAEPVWDSIQTRKLAGQACFDCHSNQTHWPWYSNLAPASWLVQRDVDRGRRELNFSEWGRRQEEADEAPESVLKRKMPPMIYLPLHPEANLSPADRQALAQGLATSLGVSLEGGEDDDD